MTLYRTTIENPMDSVSKIAGLSEPKKAEWEPTL